VALSFSDVIIWNKRFSACSCTHRGKGGNFVFLFTCRVPAVSCTLFWGQVQKVRLAGDCAVSPLQMILAIDMPYTKWDLRWMYYAYDIIGYFPMTRAAGVSDSAVFLTASENLSFLRLFV
jgi:hypothetical protein